MKSQKLGRMLQAGFTLIELIIVIVIIGIMAAVAIPIYTDLTKEARLGVLKGTAGGIVSAAATNKAVRSGGLAGQGAVGSCSAAILLVEKPADVVIYGTDTALTATSSGTCGLQYGTPAEATWTFTVSGS